MHGLTIGEDVNRHICNLFETIHNTWLQQSGKKGNDIFDATIDDLVRALEEQIRYKTRLMGRLKLKE